MEPEFSKEEKQNQTKQYLKYSGLGFQMIAVLLLALWAGQALDEKMEMKNPIWTVVFLLVGLFGSLYLVIKGVTNTKK